MRWQALTGTAVSIVAISTQQVSGKEHENWTHYGLRPLAMGNAYVAVADDFNALFYNPAGLARLKEWDGEFINPKITASANLGTLAKDIDTQMKNGDESSLLSLIESNTGESYFASLAGTPHLIFRNFGFGIGYELSSSMVFHRDISTEFDAGVRLVAPLSFAMNFLSERLSIGASIKFRARAGVDREFSMEDIDSFKSTKTDTNGNSIEDFVFGGSGVGSDFGMLFTPSKTMEPTIGISVTDAGGTPYKKQDISGTAIGAPPISLPSVNAGFSLKPVQRDKLYVLTSFDMHSINQPFSFSKKMNFGTEFGYGSIIKLQAGLHQGYLSGGLQFDVGLLSLRAISYSEELGTLAGTKEDRRYAAQLKILL